MTCIRTLSLAALPAAVLFGTALDGHAAMLEEGEFQVIGDVNTEASDNPGISVTPGSEGYSTGTNGLGTGGLDGSFNNTILDYAFYTSTGGLSESLGGAANLIGAPTNSGGVGSDPTTLDIWTTNTPNAGLNNPNQNSYARPVDITASVDISGLDSGSLYMFFGVRVGTGDTYDISFTLSGDGQSDVVLTETGINASSQGAVSNNTFFVYRADFSDAGDYDTLTFFYDKNPGNNAVQSRFGGVVLTGVPEPGSLALLGLGGLLMAHRRRG